VLQPRCFEFDAFCELGVIAPRDVMIVWVLLALGLCCVVLRCVVLWCRRSFVGSGIVLMALEWFFSMRTRESVESWCFQAHLTFVGHR
jgi:hypothetical protein